MSHEIGAKVTVAGQKEVATVLSYEWDGANYSYTICFDASSRLQNGLLDYQLDPYVAPKVCQCDVIRGGCTCEAGRIELETERANF